MFTLSKIMVRLCFLAQRIKVSDTLQHHKKGLTNSCGSLHLMISITAYMCILLACLRLKTYRALLEMRIVFSKPYTMIKNIAKNKTLCNLALNEWVLAVIFYDQMTLIAMIASVRLDPQLRLGFVKFSTAMQPPCSKNCSNCDDFYQYRKAAISRNVRIRKLLFVGESVDANCVFLYPTHSQANT